MLFVAVAATAASRMEQRAKRFGVGVVISEAVASGLKEQPQGLRRLTPDSVWGISHPVAMYTSMDRKTVRDQPAATNPGDSDGVEASV